LEAYSDTILFMKLYNTLSRTIEEFEPLNPPLVRMYTCGPTVYDYTHIGHLRKYIGDDILRRTLEMNGYEVKHVMNITDVGHLTSDQDAGEDKLEKGAKKFGKTPLEVARFFEEDFFKSIDAVNIKRPVIVARATEHISQQIELIKFLEEKGFTYRTKQAVYFDVSRFPNYTKLSKQELSEKLVGARNEVVVDREKKNPQDFALWFFTTGRFKDHVLRWPSPFTEGFPGWHIECSAMSMHYLGLTLDIHTGGVDHINAHHTNEIAQSEAATGKTFSRFWVHHAFLSVEETKMSKSLGNIYTLKDIRDRGFSPLAFRYLTFQTHYRSEMNFTWSALEAAQKALEKIYEIAADFPAPRIGCAEFEGDFEDALNQDLNVPRAISVMWSLSRSNYPDYAKAESLYKMDEVLGLKIRENAKIIKNIPQTILDMAKDRDKLRKMRKFNAADKIRVDIEKKGYVVEDTDKGTKILRKI